jgi:hypothetical protein
MPILLAGSERESGDGPCIFAIGCATDDIDGDKALRINGSTDQPINGSTKSALNKDVPASET